MASSEVSKEFSKFASKTTKGSYDKARKSERMARGIIFNIGDSGRAVVSKISCTTLTKNNQTYPFIRIELKVTLPEASKGKTLSGPGLMASIKDGKDPTVWSAQDAWGAMLGMLENLGLPTEISTGYDDFQECLDWFEAAPREVSWEIVHNDRTNDNKEIKAFAIVEEKDIPSADSSSTPEEEESDDPDASYCTFRGAKYKILSEDGDELLIRHTTNGREREVERDAVEMI